MKRALLGLVTLAILAGSIGTAEAHHRHRQCWTHHHHKVCRWV